MKKISHLYRQSAQSLLILGMLFFLLVWWNLDDVFALTPDPDKLLSGKMVILYLGLAKLLDMVTGLNTHVILYSRYYRWNLVFILIFGAVTIGANVYFIPRLGIVGASVATLIALTSFNLLKQVFLWIAFRMQPFSLDTLKIIGLGLFTSAIAYILPRSGFLLADVAIRSVIIILLFGLPTYLMKLSPEMNRFADRILVILRIKR